MLNIGSDIFVKGQDLSTWKLVQIMENVSYNL